MKFSKLWKVNHAWVQVIMVKKKFFKEFIKSLIIKNLNRKSDYIKKFIYKFNINFIESGLEMNNYSKKPKKKFKNTEIK